MAGDEKAILMEIAGKIGKLEASQEANVRALGEMASGVNRLVDKLDQSDDIAREADQRARSAHHRIDRIDKIIFWVSTTVIGGVIIAVMAVVIKKGA